MEFARTELPHSGLLTTVPDCPYALLHSEVVNQHFRSRWCRWCPCGCYCFHPDPLLFPEAPACSVSGCTVSNVTAPEHQAERTDVAVVASLWAGGMPCLTLFLEMARAGWPGSNLEWQATRREQGCSHGAGPSGGGWLAHVRQGGTGPASFGAAGAKSNLFFWWVVCNRSDGERGVRRQRTSRSLTPVGDR